MLPIERLICSIRSVFGDIVEWLCQRSHWFTRRHLIETVIIVLVLVIGMNILHRLMTPHGMPVVVAEVQKQDIPRTSDYVAQTAAINAVEIRARVEGFLLTPSFTEGADVNQGDLIFTIDPQSFQAKLDQAKAQLAQDEAALAFANEQVKRYSPLADKDYVSRENFDSYRTKADQAQAAVDADRAAVQQAQLNLGYCTMTAPIAGRIGRMYVTQGNLVGAGGQDTRLATIVQLDPLYVYFAPSENDIHEILMQGQKNKLKVRIAFNDGTVFPHEGEVDFFNNQVEQATSTVAMRAVVPNPEKTLLPGLYMKAQLILGTEAGALLVPEQAIAEDQQGTYVLVVDDDDVVEQRHVTAGHSTNGSRVILKGVSAGERVITSGLQLVKPGAEVFPRLTATREPGLRDLFVKAVLAPPPPKR